MDPLADPTAPVPGLLSGGAPTPEQQRYNAFANLPDDTPTRVGVPLGALRDMIQQNESADFGGYDALAWAKGQGTPNATSLPTDQYGFPQWSGSAATGKTSHGAGAYQFEPELWSEFAPGMGISDFSKENQDAVANAAIMRYGTFPWRTNTKLADAIQQYRSANSPGVKGLLAQPSYSQLWQASMR